MSRDSFPPGVAEQLRWYVYRLIDPRNGETFYVGKGRGDRVFQHANGLPADGLEEISDPKLERIKEIKLSGLDVSHVIHLHGIATPQRAFDVEAALIDAYPGLTNKVRGQGSNDYGIRHVEEIIREYAGEEFVVGEPLLLISIGRTYYERSPYDAVRYAWKVNLNRVKRYKLVLAQVRGLVVGAYRPARWLPASRENFPDLASRHNIPDISDRHGFVGKDAEPEILRQYVNKRVPQRYRGSQNGLRYLKPDSQTVPTFC
ncbi:MAG: hypothetical protein OXR67_16930 [Chloroflexota bacterium]|nr:hypothetical protein [Chloroflexota bacterium]